MLGREMGGLAEQIGLVSGGRRFAWAIPTGMVAQIEGNCQLESPLGLGQLNAGVGGGGQWRQALGPGEPRQRVGPWPPT